MMESKTVYFEGMDPGNTDITFKLVQERAISTAALREAG
jgi:hypothetical protein